MTVEVETAYKLFCFKNFTSFEKIITTYFFKKIPGYLLIYGRYGDHTSVIYALKNKIKELRADVCTFKGLITVFNHLLAFLCKGLARSCYCISK